MIREIFCSRYRKNARGVDRLKSVRCVGIHQDPHIYFILLLPIKGEIPQLQDNEHVIAVPLQNTWFRELVIYYFNAVYNLKEY